MKVESDLSKNFLEEFKIFFLPEISIFLIFTFLPLSILKTKILEFLLCLSSSTLLSILML